MSSFEDALMTEDEIARAAHARWTTDLNRDMSAPGYDDAWRTQQCFNCSFHLKLAGQMGEDWGVCANPDSDFDRRAMFEHDGCPAHRAAYD
jgi:Protein of unknown function (DUF3027)